MYSSTTVLLLYYSDSTKVVARCEREVQPKPSIPQLDACLHRHPVCLLTHLCEQNLQILVV